MRRKRVLIPIALLIILAAVYFWPAGGGTFDKIYAKVSAERVESLRQFRADNPPRTLSVDGLRWEYGTAGSGEHTILFLHGMTGAYDIWWQQTEALQGEYRIVAVTYPAADSLEKLEKGVLAILEREGVDKFYVVGTSLGGYFAQYLAARHPERIEKAVFANTFPPNELIKAKNGTVGSLIPYLPEWLVMNVLRGSFAESIYPAAGNDELTLAFLNELSAGRMRKAQVAARYACVVEKFAVGLSANTSVLIIEAGNDPLVEEALRDQLRAAYPAARVVRVENGHFPYLAAPDFYTRQLREFFAQ